MAGEPEVLESALSDIAGCFLGVAGWQGDLQLCCIVWEPTQ